MNNDKSPTFDAEQDALRDQAYDEALDDFDSDAIDNEENVTRMAPSEAEAAAEAIQAASTQIETLNDEVAALKDRLLREMAEMENLRRRTAKEKADAGKFAVTSFARDMLSVGDNLDRALQALPDDVRENASEDIKNLFVGIELTNQEMLNVFARYGIKPLNPLNEKFDPNFHQAMFEVPNPDLPNGTVTEVVQVGYAIGDRVLRPALVGIAKGGAKAAPTIQEGELGSSVDTSA